MRLCTVEGCKREHEAKGLCTKHYQRQMRRRLGLKPTVFRSDNLRRAMITDEDARQLERILSHLPTRAQP